MSRRKHSDRSECVSGSSAAPCSKCWQGVALVLQMFLCSPSPRQNFLCTELSNYRLGGCQLRPPFPCHCCLSSPPASQQLRCELLQLCLSQRRGEFVQTQNVVASQAVAVAHSFSRVDDGCPTGAALGIREAARQGAWSFALDRKCLPVVQSRR